MELDRQVRWSGVGWGEVSPGGDVGVELRGKGASGSGPGSFRSNKGEWRAQEKDRDRRAGHC